MPKTREALTDKQLRFCDAYLTNFNGTQAAITAGYSPKTARAMASENLTKPAVIEYLAAKKQKVSEKLGFKAEDTIRGLINIATADIRDVMDFGVEEIEIPAVPDEPGKPGSGKPARKVLQNYARFKDAKDLSAAAAFPITGVTLKKDGSLSLRFADKKGALDTLARHQDLVKDALEVEMKGRTLIEGAPDERELARKLAVFLAKAARDGATRK